MGTKDQDSLWLTEGQKTSKEENFLDPFTLYGFFTNPNRVQPTHRRVKSALARTNNYDPSKLRNRNHPPGYETPDFQIGCNPTPTPATSRPASSRSGYSSIVKPVKMNNSSPTALYLGSQRNRCKSAPVQPRIYIPRRPQTAKSRSSRASSATARGAPQRAWELRTSSVTNHWSLLSPKEIETRQKTRCKSAPLPYNFSNVELINEIPEEGTDYEKLYAMTKPFACMPDLVKNAVSHNGLRHCCSAYNARTSSVFPETRQQFWPVPRPGVYRRGFVPQYFSFVKPVQFSGDSPPPPMITCTEPEEDQHYPQSQEDETILFEETFDYPATPSELSIDEQQDLSDTDVDAMDDFNVREYLESRIDSDPDDDELPMPLPCTVPPEPLIDTKEETDDQHIQTPDIDVEISINQIKPFSPELATEKDRTCTTELIPQQQEKKDENEQHNNREEIQTETLLDEEPVEVTLKNSSYDKKAEDLPPLTEKQETAEKIPPETQEKKEPLSALTPQAEPAKVTFIDSLTVTSYKSPENKEKKAEPIKPILKQPKLSVSQPKPPYMDEKPPDSTLKKPKPRPIVERREADVRPQVKPGIVLKPEPPAEEKKKDDEKKEEKEEVLTLEEKLPEPEFIEAPGSYRMYQPIDLHQHEQAKAKIKNRINSRASQMPLPTFTGTQSHYQMLPESTSVINAVMEDERRKREGMKPWLQGRLALSKQTSRFELPMDVKILESMTAMEYLTTYCIISTRRKALFKHIFQKVDKDRDGIIGFRELEKGLKEIHVDSIDVKQVRSIVEMIGADDKTKFNLKQFSAISALSERILFSNFVTEETKNVNSTKEIIEEADFCSLKWKLDGFKVNPNVRRILEAL